MINALKIMCLYCLKLLPIPSLPLTFLLLRAKILLVDPIPVFFPSPTAVTQKKTHPGYAPQTWVLLCFLQLGKFTKRRKKVNCEK